MIKSEGLHTVCQEAACPNVGECWERGTATFMILGDTCTRRCGFCNVKTGKPTWNDPLEPARVARSVAKMGLRHAVITSVDRDDLPDYGASAFVGVIRSIRMQAPECKVEVLTPDFRGEEMPLAKVITERPDVFNHNVEVVPRLYPVARRGSRWERSLRVLANAKEMGGDEVVTKSGLMVGLGETHEEMVEAFGALREHGVQVLTVGQYLRPTERHLPVVRFWHPDEFKALEDAAYALGFDHIAAGPLVRSSYHADQHVPQSQPGTGPLAADRLVVPAQGQHPHRPLPGRHGGADRAQRDRLPLLAAGRDLARRPERGQPALLHQPHRLRAVPLRDHAPGRPLRGGPERRDRLRGTAGCHRHRRSPAADVADALHVDVHARRPAAPRRQHAVPVGLRQQRRGLHGPGEVRALLPPRGTRGDGRPGARGPKRGGARASGRPGRWPGYWAVTSCSSRAPASSR